MYISLLFSPSPSFLSLYYLLFNFFSQCVLFYNILHSCFLPRHVLYCIIPPHIYPSACSFFSHTLPSSSPCSFSITAFNLKFFLSVLYFLDLVLPRRYSQTTFSLIAMSQARLYFFSFLLIAFSFIIFFLISSHVLFYRVFCIIPSLTGFSFTWSSYCDLLHTFLLGSPSHILSYWCFLHNKFPLFPFRFLPHMMFFLLHSPSHVLSYCVLLHILHFSPVLFPSIFSLRGMSLRSALSLCSTPLTSWLYFAAACKMQKVHSVILSPHVTHAWTHMCTPVGHHLLARFLNKMFCLITWLRLFQARKAGITV